jgi:hypothetical protein
MHWAACSILESHDRELATGFSEKAALLTPIGFVECFRESFGGAWSGIMHIAFSPYLQAFPFSS